MVIRFQLNQKGTFISEKKGLLNDIKSWIDNFAPLGSNQEDFNLINKSFDSALTHSGLIYYIHFCWAKEMGCVLRPDMILYTILSEISNQILDYPDEYRQLFTHSNKKQDVVMQDSGTIEGAMDPRQLIDLLAELVKNKDFFNVICKTSFKSDVLFAREARFMAFGKMAVPYFNYLTTMCGIQSVDIINNINDWEKLKNKISKLSSILEKIQTSETISIKRVLAMLKKSSKTIKTLIYYSFGKDYKNILPEYNSRSDFFNDIFSYGKNVKCGSGHDTYLVKGWIKNFYINDTDCDLYKYSPSLSYVPYINLDTKRMFVQVCTLAYSKISDNIAEAYYGKVTFQVLNQETFKKLTSQVIEEETPNLEILNKKVQHDNLFRIYQGFSNVNFDTIEENEKINFNNQPKNIQRKERINDSVFNNRFSTFKPSGLHYDMNGGFKNNE